MSKTEFELMMNNLNIEFGDVVYIESQMSPAFFNPIKLNYLIKLLMDYLGDEGTIVVSVSGFNYNLDIKEEMKDFIVPYNEETANLYNASKIGEFVKGLAGSKISNNGFFPYVAIGKYANLIVNGQSFDFPNGSNSPFARLYELRAKAILIEHNIKDFLLNDHCLEVSSKASVYIDYGIIETEIIPYMRKRLKGDFVKTLFSMKKYKELFYYSDYNKRSYLSVDVRDYVDFTVEVIEGS